MWSGFFGAVLGDTQAKLGHRFLRRRLRGVGLSFAGYNFLPQKPYFWSLYGDGREAVGYGIYGTGWDSWECRCPSTHSFKECLFSSDCPRRRDPSPSLSTAVTLRCTLCDGVREPKESAVFLSDTEPFSFPRCIRSLSGVSGSLGAIFCFPFGRAKSALFVDRGLKAVSSAFCLRRIILVVPLGTGEETGAIGGRLRRSSMAVAS